MFKQYLFPGLVFTVLRSIVRVVCPPPPPPTHPQINFHKIYRVVRSFRSFPFGKQELTYDDRQPTNEPDRIGRLASIYYETKAKIYFPSGTFDVNSRKLLNSASPRPNVYFRVKNRKTFAYGTSRRLFYAS